MYSQVNSVKEAAQVLDKDSPDWEKKVNISILDMNDFNKCILGQIYGEYGRTLEKLFGYYHAQSEPFFSQEVYAEEWITEINNRLNKDEVHDLAWAILRIKEGKKVRNTIWSDDRLYWYIKDNDVYNTYTRVKFGEVYNSNIESKTWEIYNPVLQLRDVVAGQKFEFIDKNLPKNCLKVSTNNKPHAYLYEGKYVADGEQQANYEVSLIS